MRKIIIGIGNAEESAGRFVDVWHQAARGLTRRGPEERLIFEDLETLLRVLTPKRWALLKSLKREGPMSVRALAKVLKRDYKNVHSDINVLERLGLTARTQSGEVTVPWESVIAEMRLAA